MAQNSPEQASESNESVELQQVAVTQPEKMSSLLDTIELLNTVSERMGEDRSGDLGSSGGSGGTAQQGDDDAVSAREAAIANLPNNAAMQKELEKHIKTEVKKLRKEIRKEAHKVSKPGSMHKLNGMYARIRRMNSMLSELFSASVDTVKRLYIRIFVDKQSILNS